MIGRTFGRYRIVERLGEGGMGTVWKAEDDLLGRSVALKLLGSRLAESDNARARLLREARAAGAMDHPGIGTVYDAGEQDGEIFIAMRLVDGGTVADRIQSQGALGLLDAVRIAASAADALGSAHARGILHRDVSARNLMLTKDGQVIVVDFGLALAEGTSRLTQSGTTVGTAYYMAPEIALGQQADRRSDIYSLGAVFYELLTGAPPFEGDRLQAVLFAAVNTPASSPSVKRPGIPVEIDRIVVKALAKNPDERYANMEALRDDLEALEASGAIATNDALATIQPRQQTVGPTATLFPAMVRPLRSPSRNRRFVAVAAAVVLLGLAAGGLTWLVRGRASSSHPTYSSIAVLPFKNTSESPADSEYLSEGLSQALINKLTQMSNLHLLPWNTVGRFRDSAIPVKRLATDLRVDALLFGTFRQEGQRIRGTVSIVDGKSGSQVWADEFDEPLADLFALQNRIAISAATKLLGKLSGKQAEVLAVPAAASVAAYEFYLKGSLAMQKQTHPDNEEALGHFRRAIELDPRYAPAWVGIGAFHANRNAVGLDGVLKDLATAEEAHGKALEFDPNSIAARRGLIRTLWERGKSEECLKQGKLIASSGATGTEAVLGRAEAYVLGGLAVRSLPLLRRVMAEEPANQAAPWLMTLAAGWARSFQEVVDAGEKVLAAHGGDVVVHSQMAAAFQSMGRRADAEAHWRRAVETEPPGSVSLGPLYLAAFLRQDGRLDEADRLILDTIDAGEAKLRLNPKDYQLRAIVGIAYGMVGDLVRMREEETRFRHHRGDAALNNLVEGEGLVGEKARFVELRRAMLRVGNVFCQSLSEPYYLDPHLESYPGYKELAAEQAVECKRLEALY